MVHCVHVYNILVHQNLSKRALNRQTVSTSTTELGRLFVMLTIRAEKEYFSCIVVKRVIE